MLNPNEFQATGEIVRDLSFLGERRNNSEVLRKAASDDKIYMFIPGTGGTPDA